MPMFDFIRDALQSAGSGIRDIGRDAVQGIRNAGQRISDDPWEAADLFIPGNTRQNGEWNPAGIAAGVGQIATGVPAALSQGFISNLFRGGNRDPMTHAGLGPTNATPTTSGAGFLQGGFGGGSGRDPNWRMGGVSDWAQGASGAARAATDARNSEIANEARGTTSDINDFRGGRPVLSRGESTGGGNMGGVTLGLGQLGRGGDEAIAAHVRSLFNRPQGER